MQLPHNTEDKGPPTGSEIPNPHHTATSVPLSTSSVVNQENDFSEFMWMANEDLEAFDQKVISDIDEQLGIKGNPSRLKDEEEDFLQRMLDEEEERDTVYFNQPVNARPPQNKIAELNSKMHRLNVSDGNTSQSTLNPLAAEFVPGQSFPSSNMSCEGHRSPLASSSPIHYIQNPMYAHAIPLDAHQMPVDTNGMPANIISGQQPFNNVKMGHCGNMPSNIPLSGHIRPQINGQGPAGSNNYYGGLPFYIPPNLPGIPVMNGSYIRPQQNHMAQPPQRQNERCNDDEGYGDN